MKRSIPYGRQSITEEDIKAVVDVLQADYLTTGPKVAEFEDKFAKYVDAKYAVAVSNGTAALHLCAMSLGVNESSKVITSPITFSASANCIRYCGGELEFCDIDPETLVLDVKAVKEKLENAPKGTYSGIIPIDFAGYPVNLEEFRVLADEYDLWILEDACHAPGGAFIDSSGNTQKCGNGRYADLSIFSFHPVKHIACGEGGMITTKSKEHYIKLKQLRSHGMVYQGDDRLTQNHGKWYMELQDLGYNYRIPDILCALGITQLAKADAGLAKRKAIAKRYDEAFSTMKGIKTHVPDSGAHHAYHLYVIEVEDRKGLYDNLREHGIYAQIHYIPVHTMPYYKELYGTQSFPHAEEYYSRCISLPMYPTLTDEEQEFVIEKIISHID